MSSSDDFIDVRIRFTRGANPLLFKALEGIDAKPGGRTRNDFLKQLAEVGLMVHEERMRRDPDAGLSTRVSSGLASTVSSSILPRPVPSTPAVPVTPALGLAHETADLPVAHSVIPSPPMPADQAAAPIVVAAKTPVAPQSQSALPPAADDDRPPPRIAGQGARRLLAGDTGQ